MNTKTAYPLPRSNLLETPSTPRDESLTPNPFVVSLSPPSRPVANPLVGSDSPTCRDESLTSNLWYTHVANIPRPIYSLLLSRPPFQSLRHTPTLPMPFLCQVTTLQPLHVANPLFQSGCHTPTPSRSPRVQSVRYAPRSNWLARSWHVANPSLFGVTLLCQADPSQSLPTRREPQSSLLRHARAVRPLSSFHTKP